MKRREMIFFHNPWEENGYLSNWFLSEFTQDGIRFTSVEQSMMYHKAMLFSDKDSAAKIMATDDVAEIKKLGRRVYPFEKERWDEECYQIVRNAVQAKFEQNLELKESLINTGGAILVECAVHDPIWGIGRSMFDPGRFYKEDWKGKNLLGNVLMDVRKSQKIVSEHGQFTQKYITKSEGAVLGLGDWFYHGKYIIVGNENSAYAVPLEIWNQN